MLVLSRKLNEEILIDGGIRVKVLEINANRIRLGIVAPPQVTVLRDEVARQRQQQTKPPIHDGLKRSLELAHT